MYYAIVDNIIIQRFYGYSISYDKSLHKEYDLFVLVKYVKGFYNID